MNEDELNRTFADMMMNRVVWGKDRHGDGPYLLIGDWNGSAWEFAEQESGAVSWHEIPSTPALVAKAEELAKGRTLRREPRLVTRSEEPPKSFRPAFLPLSSSR